MAPVFVGWPGPRLRLGGRKKSACSCCAGAMLRGVAWRSEVATLQAILSSLPPPARPGHGGSIAHRLENTKSALSALEMFVQCAAQLRKVVAQAKQEFTRLARRAEDFSRHVARRALERGAGFCQADKHEPLVVGAARTLDVTLRFEALE